MSRTFHIETWGCQMNDLDSLRIASQLRLAGYSSAAEAGSADLLLLNTCSIREKSEHKVYSRLGELREMKNLSDGRLKIGVCGCVAQQEGERILKRAPWVDFVMGPASIGLIDELLAGERRIAVEFPEDRVYDYASLQRPSATLAQITIMEGCNKNCTFCIVPFTRGREVSRAASSIVAEVQHAVETGRVEIELLGQTVNAYRCASSGMRFGALLSAVASVPGVARLRFMTSHPAEVDEAMIAAMRDHQNISRYLHLPVQSGSSAVLRRMKRLYTRERYLEVIGQLQEAVPGIHFSTDFIVGFPGETDEDFEQTLSLMQEVNFGSLFAFKYSPRPGTPALRLGEPVDDAVATERLNRLFAVHEEMKRERLQSYIGKTLPVLCEGPSRHNAAMLSGRTDDNVTVNFRSAERHATGRLIPVMIQEAQHHTLRGEAVP